MLIFISYRSSDRELVQTLANDLDALGHTIWFDQELTGGHAWWNSILNKVRECDVFIFALSPRSLDSYPCQLEYGYADALGKRILPVLLTDINNDFLPPALSRIQFVDYRVQDKKASIGLARALTALPPSTPHPDPLPVPPEAPISGLGRVKERIESTTRLNLDEQAALVLEIKGFYQKLDTQATARDLLERFRNRTDLFASIDREIQSILGTFEPANAPIKPPAIPTAPTPAPRNLSDTSLPYKLGVWAKQFVWAYLGALIALVPLMTILNQEANFGPNLIYAVFVSVGFILAKNLPGWLGQILAQPVRRLNVVLTIGISGAFAEAILFYLSISYIGLYADQAGVLFLYYVAPFMLVTGFVIGSIWLVTRIQLRLLAGAAGILGCYLWLYVVSLNSWSFPLVASASDTTLRDYTLLMYDFYPLSTWCWYIAVALACSLLVYWPELSAHRQTRIDT